MKTLALLFLMTTLLYSTSLLAQDTIPTHAEFPGGDEGWARYLRSIEKDPGYGTAEKVMRVFKRMPRWSPAILNGKNVVYRQTQRISFQVQ